MKNKMKRVALVGIFVLALFTTQQAMAVENHKKPTSGILTEVELRKNDLMDNKNELRNQITKAGLTPLGASQTNEFKDISEIDKNDRRASSLASPTILDIDYIFPYVISAAIAKSPDNVSAQRSGYNPMYFYYDNVGDLDYATNSVGTKIADVSYCDGSEIYFCPIGWADWIDFDPLGAHDYLEFHYSSDTPSTNYHASFSGEPDIFIYNINIADGASVASASDPLYEGDGVPKILIDTSQVTGYVAGDPLDVNWSLYLDDFSDQRLLNINNSDSSKLVGYTQSTSRSIYRFWSDAKQHHFFTMSKPEKNHVVNAYDDSVWKFEGVSSKGYATQETSTAPVFRFWSDAKQGHFYTISAVEKASIEANDPSWKYEDIAYYAYPSDQSGTTAIHRFWSAPKQGHFYTISVEEKNSIIANDPSWAYEGIAWYVPTN